MNKIHVFKITVLVMLAMMLFVFNNCVPEVPGQKSGTSRNPSSAPAPLPEAAPKSEAEILNAIQVTTGVKNYEQILHTMSALTGVDSQNADIRRIYNEVQSSLPTGNDVKVFMASHQVAITKLAAEYCHVLVESATLRAALWPSFNFELTIAGNAFSSANRLYLVQTTIDAFWMVSSEEEQAMAEQQLMPMFDELIAGENTGSRTVTRNIVKSVCTSTLSSAQVTLL